jgi:hypothetical protein
LKPPKLDDDIAGFPFFEKLDRTLSCEGKLARKATGYEKSRRPTGSGFAGYASRASRHHSIVSVTHRFL